MAKQSISSEARCHDGAAACAWLGALSISKLGMKGVSTAVSRTFAATSPSSTSVITTAWRLGAMIPSVPRGAGGHRVEAAYLPIRSTPCAINGMLERA